MTTINITEVLTERGNRYGSYFSNALYTQNIYAEVMLMWTGNACKFPCKPIDAVIKETVHMVIHKLSRRLNGDKNYLDNYVDIIGYIQVMVDTFEINSSGALPIIKGYNNADYNADIIHYLKKLVVARNNINTHATFKAKVGEIAANIISLTRTVVYIIKKETNNANNANNGND